MFLSYSDAAVLKYYYYYFYGLFRVFGNVYACYINFFYSSLGFNILFFIFLFFGFFLFDKVLNLIFLRFEEFFFFLFGLDSISIFLLSLAFIVFPLCFLYNNFNCNFSYNVYNLILLFLEFFIIFCFIINHLFGFYFLFESLLFPMFIILGLWGLRGRKIHASYLFFFFTSVSSFFVFCGVFFLYFEGCSLFFSEFNFLSLDKVSEFTVGVMFLGGFSAKVPILPFHIWLPEAHVEAPTIGSVLLAALLLKFGYYGIVKTIIPICSSDGLIEIFQYILIFCLVSLVYGGVVASRQVDLKKIIAYSSVVHMNLSLLGIFVFSYFGFCGCLFSMITHGVISAAMFFCIGFLYERFHVRNVFYFGGLSQYMPLFSFFFFFIVFNNMSLPGTSNFIGEFLVFSSLFFESFFLTISSLSSIILVAIFCLLLLFRSIFYQISGFFEINLYDLNFPEFCILVILCFYMVVYGLYPVSLLQFV